MSELYLFFLCLGLFHCCIYFFDTFFKTCLHLPYLNLLRNTGIQVKVFRLLWYTTALNRYLQKWGSSRPKFLFAWFSIGSWVTIALIPIAFFLLIRSTYLIIVKNIVNEEKYDASALGTLQTMVPGINLPLSELFYYLSTLLLCTIVHEMGHAVAAVREDGRVSGVGVVLAFCVPVTYVSLENIESLPVARQLRVFCGGVWHNILLALVAACTAFVLPWLLLPLYDWGSGVQIQTVQEDSPVFGFNGLMPKDLVVQINDCPVADITSWQNCLVEAVRSPSPGHCLHSEFINEHDESIPAKHMASGTVECCSNSPRHLCFEYLERDDEPLQLRQYSCLNVRAVTEEANFFCYKPQDCKENLYCFQPSLENSTRLVSIKTQTGKVVLFLGHPAEVYQSVSVSSFRDLYSMFPSSIPERITLFCHYIISFSIGIAVLNVVPCYYFDGQHILRTLMDVYFTKQIEHSSVRHAISICLSFFGTVTLSIYLVASLWSTIK